VRRLLLIGIGAGAPELLTLEAIEAMRQVDVFLVIDKGEAKADLAAFRREVIDRFASQPHRVVEVADRPRGDDASYETGVATWHAQRGAALEEAMVASVGDGECAAVLVWGDPSLYDSTIRLVEQLAARGTVELEWSVVPGISSVALLAARHRITLNRIGRSVHVTTGRLVREGLPAGLDDVVVLLDGDTAFTTLVGQGYDIYWGAYLGTPDELLVAGPLDDVADSIVQRRREARQRKGWVFDTYLLRRRQA
jgi:precorrin-6A synthase